MFADKIEQAKQHYTDKLVIVDASRPELARFRDVVGRVKTVNMNGRALVEFEDYHLNIGWYDIAPEYLKVVDQPPPKPAKTEAKKAPSKKTGQPAAAGEAKTGAKLSVADMLAAARSGGAVKAGDAATPPAKAKAAPTTKPATDKADRSKMSVADMLAAARAGGAAGSAPQAAAPAAEDDAQKAPPAAPAQKSVPTAQPAADKVDRSKMSVADMLAAARAGGAAGSAPQAATPAAEDDAEEAPPAAPAQKSAPTAKPTADVVDRTKMSVDDMLAWCRQHDTK